MNSLLQMPLVTTNVIIFFGNVLPTSLQKLNLSKVLDHSHQSGNTPLTLQSVVALKEHYLHK